MKSKSLLLTLILLGAQIVGYPQQVATVTGRAVDKKGVPILGARVSLYYPPCRGCIDHILPVGVSFPDGVFYVEAGNISGKGLRLFIEGPVPAGFWSPFGSPPFEHLAHLAAFRGIPIKPRRGNRRVELGDVLVKIQYGKVIIELSKIFGTQYQPHEAASRLLSITVRSPDRKIIYNGRVPRVAFDHTFSAIHLALTKNRWTVELFFDSQNQKIRSQQLHIDLERFGTDQHSEFHLPQF